eukprot:TRINITY_DN16969_c0_g2_i2.p5 TRINITY_DN16969_c0_g2~~TRINITY_DN16969_c0_g2_i2.p5  ORF type:complete len:105 (-),score=31.49 TRINITY_DN16969_c0_g2_i2:242-556(-)
MHSSGRIINHSPTELRFMLAISFPSSAPSSPLSPISSTAFWVAVSPLPPPVSGISTSSTTSVSPPMAKTSTISIFSIELLGVVTLGSLDCENKLCCHSLRAMID